MKRLIIGKARHGKDTFALLLAEYTGASFISSSEFCNERAVFPVLKDKYGYTSLEECFNDRGSHREEWKALISAYNTPDKARLAKEMLENHDFYVGMRCHIEYEASKHLFDQILWVDASDRVAFDDPSMSIKFNPAEMVWIDNNGCQKALKRQAVKIATLEGAAG
jgi:dephospho-CoA kinase